MTGSADTGGVVIDQLQPQAGWTVHGRRETRPSGRSTSRVAPTEAGRARPLAPSAAGVGASRPDAPAPAGLRARPRAVTTRSHRRPPASGARAAGRAASARRDPDRSGAGRGSAGTDPPRARPAARRSGPPRARRPRGAPRRPRAARPAATESAAAGRTRTTTVGAPATRPPARGTGGLDRPRGRGRRQAVDAPDARRREGPGEGLGEPPRTDHVHLTAATVPRSVPSRRRPRGARCPTQRRPGRGAERRDRAGRAPRGPTGG